MKKFYIYFLRRPDKIDPIEPWKHCPFYVGKGCNGRINQHRIEARSLLNKSGRKSAKITIIHKLWKQGLDFEEEIYLDNLTAQEAFEYECQIIATYGRRDNETGILANLTDGGDGPFGYIHSIEHKKKMRVLMTGRIFSEESKRKMSEACKGKLKSEEHRRKLSQAKKGTKWSQESLEKFKLIRKELPGPFLGKHHTKETRQKISEFLTGRPGTFKGKNHTEEAKRKMGEFFRGRKLSEEHKQKIRDGLRRRKENETIKN